MLVTAAATCMSVWAAWYLNSLFTVAANISAPSLCRLDFAVSPVFHVLCAPLGFICNAWQLVKLWRVQAMQPVVLFHCLAVTLQLSVIKVD